MFSLVHRIITLSYGEIDDNNNDIIVKGTVWWQEVIRRKNVRESKIQNGN
jgi:hypothetical protein